MFERLGSKGSRNSRVSCGAVLPNTEWPISHVPPIVRYIMNDFVIVTMIALNRGINRHGRCPLALACLRTRFSLCKFPSSSFLFSPPSSCVSASTCILISFPFFATFLFLRSKSTSKDLSQRSEARTKIKLFR